MHKISIIIPTYNAENYIERCINSCLNQDYENVEVIVVDDGSTDKTLQICDSVTNKFENVKIISQKNSGVSAARNHGIEASLGDYILFVDADDYIEKDMCSQLAKNMTDEIDMVICGYYIEKNSIQEKCSVKEARTYLRRSFPECLNSLQENALLYTCWNKLFRKQKIKTKFPVGMTFGEDSVFNFHYLVECDAIKEIPYIGYHYSMENSVSAMHRYHSNMFGMIEKEFIEILNCLLIVGGKEEFAQKHLMDNVLYFFLPRLFETDAIDKRKKIIDFLRVSDSAYVKNALKTYQYRGKKQQIILVAIQRRWYFIASLMYCKKRLKRN